ncbi:hypothetical protein KXS11_15280 [Plantibacter flavus]
MAERSDRPTPDAAELAARRAAKAERSQRADLITVLVVAIVAAVGVVVSLVLRLLDIFGTGGVTVPVQFAPFEATQPGGGATVRVGEGTVVVSDLPFATFASVVLAAVIPAVASLVVIGCALWFFRRMLRGDAFAPGNARLLTVASFGILAAWISDSWFGTMASNGALAVASGDAFSGIAVEVSWLPVLAAMAVGGLAIAFRSGERLRADTDGLV